MFRCILVALLAVLPVSTPAVEFNIVAQDLKEANGDLMRVGGLVVLVVSTADTEFDEIQPDTVLSAGTAFNPLDSDDLVLAKWATPSLGSTGPLVYNSGPYAGVSPSWNLNDPFRLYWFPTLSVSDTQPGESAPYGYFPNHNPLDPDIGESGWVTPPGDTVDPWPLSFLTVNYLGGTQPTDRGVASFTVVPEPSFYAGAFAAGCLAWAAISKRRELSAP